MPIWRVRLERGAEAPRVVSSHRIAERLTGAEVVRESLWPSVHRTGRGLEGVPLIWLGSGTDDIFFGGAKAFADRLQTVKVPHVFRQFAGGHSMPVFRQELVELLPLLFQR